MARQIPAIDPENRPDGQGHNPNAKGDGTEYGSKDGQNESDHSVGLSRTMPPLIGGKVTRVKTSYGGTKGTTG